MGYYEQRKLLCGFSLNIPPIVIILKLSTNKEY